MTFMEPTSLQVKAITVIPVYEALQETIDCVKSVLDSDAGNYPIWLLNDGSPIDVERALRQAFGENPQVHLTTHVRNRGYTRSLDLALKSIEAPYFCVLNSDTIVPEHWFENLITRLEENPTACAIGPVSNAASYQSMPKVRATDGGGFSINEILSPKRHDLLRYNDILNHFSGDRIIQSMTLNGFCTMFRNRAFRDAGGLDSRNFREGYGEENDLFIRMAREGWRSFVDPNVFVFHKKSRSFGDERRSALSKLGNRILNTLYGEKLRSEVDCFQSSMFPLDAIRVQFEIVHDTNVEYKDLKLDETLLVKECPATLLTAKGPMTLIVTDEMITSRPLTQSHERLVVSMSERHEIKIDLPNDNVMQFGNRRPILSVVAALSLTSFERPIFLDNWNVDGHADQQHIDALAFGMLFAAPNEEKFE